MHVVIIGAGAVGLCSAYYLAGAGADVTVLDARDVGGGASRRNAGWIVPSMSGPVPAPGVVLKSLRWMLQRDSPLYIRPSLDPAFIRFITSMLRHCNDQDFDRGMRATLKLNRRTFELFDQLEKDGLSFEHHKQGLLLAFTDEHNLQAHETELQHAAKLGAGPAITLTAAEARSEVPMLSDSVVGAIDCPTERFLSPDSFLDALADGCRARGVTIQTGQTIRAIEKSTTGVVTAVGGIDRWAGDAFVIATGAWSGDLLRKFGSRLPIQAGKGYGFDIPTTDSTVARALYLSEAKVALTPLNGHTRLAGTMGFGGMDERVADRRAHGIVTSARHYLSGWPGGPVPRAWSGLRPMTPDGLPYIGLLPNHDNVVIATGHAMLGITLSPATGDIVRELLIEGHTPLEAVPFRPDRLLQQ
jgi:D-amino-acid dehydrogenase